MRPVEFRGVTQVLGKPTDWDDDRHGPCAGLPVMHNGDCIVSCWKPTWREMLTMVFGGGVFLWVVGSNQPVVALQADFFKKQ